MEVGDQKFISRNSVGLGRNACAGFKCLGCWVASLDISVGSLFLGDGPRLSTDSARVLPANKSKHLFSI